MRKSKHLRFYFALTLAILLVFIAAMGPMLAPNNPNKNNLQKTLQPPNSENLLGTDRLGRDMLSRILYAARSSLALTFFMVLIAACVGVLIGVFAGFLGGVVDFIAMQITDVLLSFPTVVFAIAIVGIWGTGIFRVLLALVAIGWAKYARVVRGAIINIRYKEYVILAKFSGARWHKVAFRYVLPNILPQIAVITTQDVGEMMLILSALSFLELVGQPPAPEWGSMLADSRYYIMTKPYLFLFPALSLFITVAVFNLLGDSIRDILDPREK